MAFDFTNIKAKGKLNGLSSFSSLPAEDDTIKITPIPIDMIDPYTESLHPFKSYTVDKIDELAESIKVNGLLQPIIVSRKSDGRYMIIAGHNRFRACQKNNMDTIDAVVRNELTATQRKLMMVDTNLEQRHKLTAKERALAYKIKQDCLKELGATNPTAVIAKENGESRKSVQRYIAISRLTPELLDMVDTDRIKLSVGVTVSAVDTETQNSLSEYLISEGEKATVDEKQAKEIQLEATVKPLSVDDIAEILEKKPQKEKKQSDIIKIHSQINNEYADETGSIELTIKDKTVTVEVNNNLVSSIKDYFSLNTEALYLDDPFILDELPGFNYRPRLYNRAIHQFHLRAKLLQENNGSEIEEVVREEAITGHINKVIRKIDKACNGELANTSGGVIYKSDLSNKVFRMANVSTGLKTFIIIKRLLLNGSLEDNGTLILDEPEIHLHPEWQVLFAEIIVLLQKEFNMHILLNTHSPYFIEAIEVFVDKYGVKDKSCFYLAEKVGNEAIVNDVTGKTEKIYKQLAEPFQVLENLRWEND